MNRLRSALWLPLFDDLADPRVVARLAADAEEAGWDGCFVWDQLCWRAPVQQVGDPWIALAAIATKTERLRLGPMVSPLPRRRPAKVARETAALDRLSGGRLTLGVGMATCGTTSSAGRCSPMPVLCWSLITSALSKTLSTSCSTPDCGSSPRIQPTST
ncbi:LLM class flavin-dependent oxidoreductase [Nonomuraea aurantiaca]|uniref:LLM class flavin-dependent oxidoreductase n=1 Tax=Nonomuraea aurantiaca TaxID=2878562 RepID=UPI001CD9D8DE|nr:LLM class flavin-dependent oxidoreductase [Nonomuraea aurantiaca]MCA2229496.1 LLM class flavin-dependent oxidoreductase [Nonomuraea aurantiaca]